MLDPEFYEEPYERFDHYAVSLTFSDFGILDRLRYNLSGTQTLQHMVAAALSRADLPADIDQHLISSSLTKDGTPITLSSLSVSSANFYDEDGEPMTMREVLEGILQPLGLRIVQRCGRIHVYDLNGLHTRGERVPLRWSGSSSTMGTDKVYNNITITWSPYVPDGLLTPSDAWPGSIETPVTQNTFMPEQPTLSDSVKSLTYFPSNDRFKNWNSNSEIGFTIWLTKNGEGVAEISPTASYYKTVPQIDGTASNGIAAMVKGLPFTAAQLRDTPEAKLPWISYGYDNLNQLGSKLDLDSMLLRCKDVELPPSSHPEHMALRLAVPLLLDCRYNPFEDDAIYEEKNVQNLWHVFGNFLYVPVLVKFTPADGSAPLYWTNRGEVLTDIKDPRRDMFFNKGFWHTEPIEGYLSWYDESDRAEKCAVCCGFQTNKHAINPHTEPLRKSMTAADDGQYITYPDHAMAGGTLSVSILDSGWLICDGGINLQTAVNLPTTLSLLNNKNAAKWVWESLTDKGAEPAKWVLFELPRIEIVSSSVIITDLNDEDLQYSAEINPDAREELNIDTICGSTVASRNGARGVYIDVASGYPVTEMTRAGRTTQIENLLIGTIYSQYATRHTTLSGEADIIICDGIPAVTEQNQPGKAFIITGETQDCIADTSDTTIIELNPDEYSQR